MNKQEAIEQALSIKKQEHFNRGTAVVWTADGQEWAYGWHPESRYLETYFETAKEIWINDSTEFTCYKSLIVAVDYVKETGATGTLAELLRKIQEAKKSLDNQ